MNSELSRFDDHTLVTDIVTRDFHTADIFRKYGIDYCCTGKIPLSKACEARGLDIGQVKKELQEAIRPNHISRSISFKDCPLDFLIDYIAHIHHHYLKVSLPQVSEQLESLPKRIQKNILTWLN